MKFRARERMNNSSTTGEIEIFIKGRSTESPDSSMNRTKPSELVYFAREIAKPVHNDFGSV